MVRDGRDGQQVVDHLGEEARWADVIGYQFWVCGDARGGNRPIPVDQQQGSCGVAVNISSVPEFSDHVDGALERVRFITDDRCSLNEKVADGGEGITSAEIAGVAVGFFEPVGQVLTEARELRFG